MRIGCLEEEEEERGKRVVISEEREQEKKRERERERERGGRKRERESVLKTNYLISRLFTNKMPETSIVEPNNDIMILYTIKTMFNCASTHYQQNKATILVIIIIIIIIHRLSITNNIIINHLKLPENVLSMC